MTTNVNGAMLSDKLLNTIKDMQAQNNAGCRSLLDVLDNLTDVYIDTPSYLSSKEKMSELQNIRDMYHLVVQIKNSTCY